jgi:transposase
MACGECDAPRMTPSVVADINHMEGAPTHGEGSQLGWTGRARAQRVGGDRSRASCARPGCRARPRRLWSSWRSCLGRYEAGPTGYEPARALQAAGIGCAVAAPGKIERPAQDKIKTDQRDAERVLRLLMVDALHPVRVPTVEEEALRDLVRAREDVRGDLMRARQRLSKLLLRPQRHRSWLRAQDLGRGAQATLLDYLGAIPRRAGIPCLV